MSHDTKIEWASAGLPKGATWNPIRARNRSSGAIGWHCEHVSEACRNCYAERFNARKNAAIGTGLPYKPAHRENGDVEVYLDETMLTQPLRWKKPRGIFVCSMTDAFADFVPDPWLDKIFAVAALAPQHRFLFLTKRAKRMWEYMTTQDRKRSIAARVMCISEARAREGGHDARIKLDHFSACFKGDGPFPNVWLGVTAEDQDNADERLSELRRTPAARRFISFEPLLGPVFVENWLAIGDFHWAISGGESGPDARATHIDWERSIRDQCAAAGVPYFRKQIGEWKAICEMSEEEIDACYHPAPESAPEATRRSKVRSIVMHRDGAVFDDPASPGAFISGSGAMTMFRVGKRRAGRLLDGREHSEFPQ